MSEKLYVTWFDTSCGSWSTFYKCRWEKALTYRHSGKSAIVSLCFEWKAQDLTQSQSVVCHFPTRPFANSGPQHPLINEFYVVQEHRVTYFKASYKLIKGLVGWRSTSMTKIGIIISSASMLVVDNARPSPLSQFIWQLQKGCYYTTNTSSFKIRPMTFLSYIKFAHLLILRLSNCESAGREGPETRRRNSPVLRKQNSLIG